MSRPWVDDGLSARQAPRVFVHGARDATFLSGTPYHFAQALRELRGNAHPFEVVDLAPRRTREVLPQWLAWSARTRCWRSALFLLSQAYQDASVTRFPATAGDAGCVSFSQVLPVALLDHRKANPAFRLVQYIDVTLEQLMADFDYAKDAPPHVRKELLEAERRAYAASDRIAVFHEGTRDVLAGRYGVPPSRIDVLGRGVNLPLQAWAAGRPNRAVTQGLPLRLMVVGRGPRRKGVLRLVEAIDALDAQDRAQVELHVAGPSAGEMPRRPYLHALGFVDATRRAELVRTMQSMSLGVLLSEADSHPGSVWEFLSLGVPVWVSALPCLADELRGFPALLQPFPLEQGALTARLRTLVRDPDALVRLQAASTRPRADLGWSRPARAIAAALGSPASQRPAFAAIGAPA
jgi:glycosyltransferase involved in cell wall biosynthesis